MPADGDYGKGRRKSLNPGRIVEEALTLVDQSGLDGLTTRALGRQLGVDPTAIYRHFRSKDELLAAMADRIIGSSDGERLAIADHDGSPRGQLRNVCLRLRRAVLTHPTMTAIVVHRPSQGAHSRALTEHALGVLRRAGLGDDGAARAYQVLMSFTLGHAMLAAPYAAQDAAQASAELEAIHSTYTSLPASHYPNTAAVAPYLCGTLDEQFSYGLDRLLDGLGVEVSQPETGG